MKKQKVYIYKKWFEAEVDFIDQPINETILLGKNFLKAERLKFVSKLQSAGIEVVTDPKKFDKDTICLVTSPDLIPKNNKFGNVQTVLNRKIFAVAGDNFNYPTTQDIITYIKRPFLPAVFKNTGVNCGTDKFLISTPEQLTKILGYFRNCMERHDLSLPWGDVSFQQVIETPTEYKTYMRVLVSGSGEVLGSSLKCSHNQPNSVTLDGEFEKLFLRPNSPLYISAKKMFNYYSGGESISLERPGNLSIEQKKILVAHGFNPNNLQVPEEVLDVCKNIMINSNVELGVICGIDFILNARDGHWYYLELQSYPAIDEWTTARGLPLPEEGDLTSYLVRRTVELDLRYEALMMTIRKRQELESQPKF